MALIRITRTWDGTQLHEVEAVDLKTAVVDLVARGANLIGANLRDANLRGANLRGADLRGANLSDADLSDADLSDADLSDADLSDANLRDANLRGANLIGANLRDANLRGANLRGADLSGADLSDADLRDANLRGANLRDANLRDANLRGANLMSIRDDVWAVLSGAPAEVPGLIDALKAGRVNGSTYQGDCACLVGTLANVRGCEYTALAPIVPNSGRPAEVWFLQIRTGDTPETNQAARLAVEWAEEWLARMRAAFGSQATTHV